MNTTKEPKLTVYQAHYWYPASADDSLYYGGSDGDLYLNKEDCQKEIDDRLAPIDTSYEAYQKEIENGTTLPECTYDEWCMFAEYGDQPNDAKICELNIY